MKTIILMLIGTLLFASLAFSKEEMKVVYFSDYPPFSWEVNEQMHGILIDVLNEALKNRMKIPLTHEGFP
ncbi:MAG: hypothetical protein GY755_25600 [Chloroflexi bacterium]|nr:hypothetical protein [Chloroflexota bacterium]